MSYIKRITFQAVSGVDHDYLTVVFYRYLCFKKLLRVIFRVFCEFTLRGPHSIWRSSIVCSPAWASKAGGRDGGTRPPSREISGGRPPPEQRIFQYFFLDTC